MPDKAFPPLPPPPPEPPDERLYLVIGPNEVNGVPTGGLVDLSELNQGALGALIAAGHVVIAEPESSDDDSLTEEGEGDVTVHSEEYED